MNVFCPTGLIIDAFGELRDQQEQVREDMEVRLELLTFGNIDSITRQRGFICSVLSASRQSVSSVE